MDPSSFQNYPDFDATSSTNIFTGFNVLMYLVKTGSFLDRPFSEEPDVLATNGGWLVSLVAEPFQAILVIALEGNKT